MFVQINVNNLRIVKSYLSLGPLEYLQGWIHVYSFWLGFLQYTERFPVCRSVTVLLLRLDSGNTESGHKKGEGIFQRDSVVFTIYCSENLCLTVNSLESPTHKSIHNIVILNLCKNDLNVYVETFIWKGQVKTKYVSSYYILTKSNYHY